MATNGLQWIERWLISKPSWTSVVALNANTERGDVWFIQLAFSRTTGLPYAALERDSMHVLGEASHYGPVWRAVNPSGSRLVTSSRVAMAKLARLNLRCCQPSSWSMTIYTLDTYRWVASELCVCVLVICRRPTHERRWLAEPSCGWPKSHLLRAKEPGIALSIISDRCMDRWVTDKCRCPTLRCAFLVYI